mmetsp:Transcript_33171/g.102801  ORF Transcript_33171/g.102801 Transcript_33171/m.102801 type:complete len:208 (+) Transcript_33171:760-1383(+)
MTMVHRGGTARSAGASAAQGAVAYGQRGLSMDVRPAQGDPPGPDGPAYPDCLHGPRLRDARARRARERRPERVQSVSDAAPGAVRRGGPRRRGPPGGVCRLPRPLLPLPVIFGLDRLGPGGAAQDLGRDAGGCSGRGARGARAPSPRCTRARQRLRLFPTPRVRAEHGKLPARSLRRRGARRRRHEDPPGVPAHGPARRRRQSTWLL